MLHIKTHLICPSLISFQLGGVDIQLRSRSGESGFRGEVSVVKARIKPRLLGGCWLQEAVMGVLADGRACGFLEAYVGDDCLYIGFHLCVGLIFIFPRYPDAIVIDRLETTHLSGFRGGRRLLAHVQWSLKCLIRCRSFSAWVRRRQFSQVGAIP